jgi:hypothetical protein
VSEHTLHFVAAGGASRAGLAASGAEGVRVLRRYGTAALRSSGQKAVP